MNMWKKRNLFVVLCFALLTCMLCACSPATASEDEIKKTIIDRENFGEAELEITSYTETMRKTSSEDRLDMVWVSIIAENDELEYHGDYYLEYKKYDNGWILEMFWQENNFYSAKKHVPTDILNGELTVFAEDMKSVYCLDELVMEEPVLWESNLSGEYGTPYCIYCVSSYGENEYAEFSTDIFLYYEFYIDTGWQYSEYQSSFYGTEMFIEPKGDPEELLVEDTLKSYGYEDYQLLEKTEPYGISRGYSYLVKDSTTYKYMTIHYEIELSFEFNPWSGWYVSDVISNVVDADINATGRWVYDDGIGEHKYDFTILAVDGYQVTYAMDLTITDWVMSFGEETYTVSTNGGSAVKEWKTTTKSEYSLKTTDYVVSRGMYDSTNYYYLEFRSYSGDRYEESGFYFNDQQLTKVS